VKDSQGYRINRGNETGKILHGFISVFNNCCTDPACLEAGNAGSLSSIAGIECHFCRCLKDWTLSAAINVKRSDGEPFLSYPENRMCQ